MATVSPYSDRLLLCRGHACVKCGRCRDWYWRPEGKTKVYTKRHDAICTTSYAYGHLGYGPGCYGCFICCIARIPFGFLCARRYFGDDGYGHGSGIDGLHGYLVGGLKNNIATLCGVDLAERQNRAFVASVLDIGLGGIARAANDIHNLTDGTLQRRIALARSHNDAGFLCECSDNQQ